MHTLKCYGSGSNCLPVYAAALVPNLPVLATEGAGCLLANVRRFELSNCSIMHACIDGSQLKTATYSWLIDVIAGRCACLLRKRDAHTRPEELRCSSVTDAGTSQISCYYPITEQITARVLVYAESIFRVPC
jgi:hypothetical protein